MAGARDKRYRFQTFVCNGCIFARSKEEDKATLINSEEDLTDFLDSSYQTLNSNISADNRAPSLGNSSFLPHTLSPSAAPAHSVPER